MKAIITSFGSSGDFNPCLGLARTLRKKSVDVIFLSNPYYEKKITNAGLRFSPLGEYRNIFEEISSNPDYLHPRKGPQKLWGFLLEAITVSYTATKQLIENESPDFAALHTLELGGMIAAIEASLPYVTLTPTPMGWFTSKNPSHITYAVLPSSIRSMISSFALAITNFAFKHSLKPYCQKKGIPPKLNSTKDIFEKAAMNLGLWSPLLRDINSNDPQNSKICGFVRDEHIRDWPNLPDNIAKFFGRDQKPVVVALGSTACLCGDKIYQSAADACKRLNLPCLLVGPCLDKFADKNQNILSIDFAPFGWVFPRAKLIVHHGGVNSTGEAIRAGVPFVVVPHAYDQFDNSVRTQKMGISRRIKVADVTTDSIIKIFEQIPNDNQMHEKSKHISQKIIAEPDGAEIAADRLINHFKIV